MYVCLLVCVKKRYGEESHVNPLYLSICGRVLDPFYFGFFYSYYDYLLNLVVVGYGCLMSKLLLWFSLLTPLYLLFESFLSTSF